MADSNNLSPLRKWIVAEMKSVFSSPYTIWSDSKKQEERNALLYWAGATQTSLKQTWQTDPGFTLCSSFLSVVATRICQIGSMRPKFLKGFQLHTEKGWVPYKGGTPTAKEGDFFQLYRSENSRQTGHVGIILEAKAGMWGCVSGGSGGKGKGHDGMSRSELNPIPLGLLQGWLDVDAYFEFWAGPGAEDVIYEQPW